MNVLSLNCQHGYQPGLETFLQETLESGTHDFLLLQEADETVFGFLQNESYEVLRVFNTELDAESQVCIVYRADFDVVGTEFQSFASMRNDPYFGLKGPCGFICAEFAMPEASVRIGSIHLHSGIDQQVRLAEMKKAKGMLLDKPSMPTIVAGDLNAGFPGEAARLSNELVPEFTWATKHIRPTLNSRYSENVPHLPNRMAALLRTVGISIELRADHIFVDANTEMSSPTTCRVLPDRVSDHSPIELRY